MNLVITADFALALIWTDVMNRNQVLPQVELSADPSALKRVVASCAKKQFP
ncbi:hypothetical protein [Polynucleobacter necessarius]|uniref:hypothetical protein n=1 Tax=Polynucleobacter necessarius TaxID=576610 RepID=UPI0013B054A2|nr:hypothetical protein [Polynucleobacter necessarius]